MYVVECLHINTIKQLDCKALEFKKGKTYYTECHA